MPRVAANKAKNAAGSAASKPKPRPKKANGYKFPEKLPLGEILTDSFKKQWKLGPSIGQGGFGEIYSASEVGTKSGENYVVKIEPHENGPLFVEKNFYIRIAQPDDVNSWKSKKGIKVLGIPLLYGSGSHEFKNEKYRFIVIERYGKDLWSLFLNNQKKFPAPTVYKCAIQIIDALHYIHDKGYIHGDIKGANLLLGLQKGTEGNVFLVDFGLASKYNTKEFKRDPKKAHNGTIEYTSRDAHEGVPTRRGDMEILGFNILHWLGSTLPWEGDITSPEKVHDKKKKLMENVKEHLKNHYPHLPKVVASYLDYVSKMKHDDIPDYEFCKSLFLKELKSLPGGANTKLDFSGKEVAPRGRSQTPKKTPVRKSRKSTVEDEDQIANSPRTESSGLQVTPVLRKRKSTVIPDSPDESGNDSEDIFETTPTPKKVRKKAVKAGSRQPLTSKDNKVTKEEAAAKPSWRDAPAIMPSSEPQVKQPAKARAKKEAPPKKDAPPKPSWRDAPAIVASNISKAGEYQSKNENKKRTTKKKN